MPVQESFLLFPATDPRSVCSLPVNNEWRGTMGKLCYVLAALATVAIGAPSVANAEGFGVYVDPGYHHHYYGPRFGFYDHDRGLHRGWYQRYYDDRGVVIRRHHWDDY